MTQTGRKPEGNRKKAGRKPEGVRKETGKMEGKPKELLPEGIITRRNYPKELPEGQLNETGKKRKNQNCPKETGRKPQATGRARIGVATFPAVSPCCTQARKQPHTRLPGEPYLFSETIMSSNTTCKRPLKGNIKRRTKPERNDYHQV